MQRQLVRQKHFDLGGHAWSEQTVREAARHFHCSQCSGELTLVNVDGWDRELPQSTTRCQECGEPGPHLDFVANACVRAWQLTADDSSDTAEALGVALEQEVLQAGLRRNQVPHDSTEAQRRLARPLLDDLDSPEDSPAALPWSIFALGGAIVLAAVVVVVPLILLTFGSQTQDESTKVAKPFVDDEVLGQPTAASVVVPDALLGKFRIELDAKYWKDQRLQQHHSITHKEVLVAERLVGDNYRIRLVDANWEGNADELAAVELSIPASYTQELFQGFERFVSPAASVTITLDEQSRRWIASATGIAQERPARTLTEVFSADQLLITKGIPADTQIVRGVKSNGPNGEVTHRFILTRTTFSQEVTFEPLGDEELDKHIKRPANSHYGDQFIEFHVPATTGYTELTLRVVNASEAERTSVAGFNMPQQPSSIAPESTNVAELRPTRIVQAGDSAILEMVELSDDRLALRTADNVQIWDLKGDRPLARLDLQSRGEYGERFVTPSEMQLLANDNVLVLSNRAVGSSIDLWDLASYRWQRRAIPTVGRSERVVAVVPPASLSRVLVGTGTWRTRGPARIVDVKATGPPASPVVPWDVLSTSYDRRHAVIRTPAGMVAILDLVTGSESVPLAALGSDVTLGLSGTVLNGRNQIAVLGSSSSTRTSQLQIVDVVRRSVVRTVSVDDRSVGMESSPNGRCVRVELASGESTIVDAQSGEIVRKEHSSRWLGFAPDDRPVFLVDDDTAVVVSLDDSTEDQELVAPASLGKAILGFESGELAIGLADQGVAIWATSISTSATMPAAEPARELTLPPALRLVRHGDISLGSATVKSLLLSADKRQGLALLSDRRVVYFDPVRLRVVRDIGALAGNDDRFDSWAISANGKIAAIAGAAFAVEPTRSNYQHSIAMFSLATGKKIREWTDLEGRVMGMRLSSDGRQLVAAINRGSRNSAWQILEIQADANNTSSRDVELSGVLVDLEVDFSRRRMYAACLRSPLVAIDLSSGETLSLTPPLTRHVSAVELSSDANWLAVDDVDNHTIRLYNAQGLISQHEYQGYAEGIRSMGLSADGNRIVGLDAYGKLHVWQRDGGPLANSVMDVGLGDRTDLSPYLSFWSDHNSIVVGNQLWTTEAVSEKLAEIKQETIQTRVEDGQPGLVAQHAELTNVVAIVPGARTLVSTTSNGIQLHDFATGKLKRTIDVSAIHESPITSASMSSDGKLLLVSNSAVAQQQQLEFGFPFFQPRAAAPPAEQKCSLWDLESGKLVSEIGVPRPTALGFSGDGKQFVVVSSNGAAGFQAAQGWTAHVYKTATLSQADPFIIPGIPTAHALSDDQLHCLYQNGLYSFRIANGRVIQPKAVAFLGNNAALDPDGVLAALVARANLLRVLNVRTGGDRAIPLHDFVYHIHLTRDHTCVYVSNQFLGAAPLAAMNREQRFQHGHAAQNIRRLIVSPDGKAAALQMTGSGCSVWLLP